MVKKILLVLAVLAAGLAVVITLQPSTYSVRRSAIMAAPPDVVFAQIEDLAAWDAWSPWKKLDPNARTTLSTPSAGPGATLTWAGNDKIGEGSLTILDSRSPKLVRAEQVFVRPFAGKARMQFTLTPEGSGTRVTWRMDGTNNFLGKAMCLVMDMDAMVGKDFDQGLANLKAIVEKSGATPGT